MLQYWYVFVCKKFTTQPFWSKTQIFLSEIVTRKPAKMMSLDNFERKKSTTHHRPEPASIPTSNSTSLDDRLRSISKWMDNNEYSFWSSSVQKSVDPLNKSVRCAGPYLFPALQKHKFTMKIIYIGQYWFYFCTELSGQRQWKSGHLCHVLVRPDRQTKSGHRTGLSGHVLYWESDLNLGTAKVLQRFFS